MALEPGHCIGGSYRIVRPLGEGGMGAVYEVEHVQLGVHYALKTFTFNDGEDELLRNKFLAEGKVLARLHNPHLVRVFDLDFDEETGTPYFVMDLVLYKDGEPHTLADVETESLEEDFILKWFGELAEALDYIHARGIVHRDIKLNNILLNADKTVTLSDFGISRFFSQPLRKEISALNTMVSQAATGERVIMGTQGYMAPEVERGEEATPAADVYSLGVMLMYLLTGIWYESGSKVLKFLETLEYPWKDILPQMLAEDPKARPTSLTECVQKMQNRTSGMTRSATVGRGLRPRRKLLCAIAGVLAAGLLLTVALVFLLRPTTPAPSPSPSTSTSPSLSPALTLADLKSFFGADGIYEVQR